MHHDPTGRFMPITAVLLDGLTARRTRLAVVLGALAVVLMTAVLGPPIARAAAPLSWSAPATVDEPNAQSGVALSGISCPSTELCVAVDDSGNAVVATNPTGGMSAWTTAKIDGYYFSGNLLEGISCPSAGLCVAVDINGNILSSTDPTGGNSAWHLAHLESVVNVREISCPSTELCVAVDDVGEVITATDPTGNATAWTRMPVDSAGELSGISCPSTSLCVAVDRKGHVLTATDPTGDAAAWTSVKIDSAEGGFTGLSAVSCPTTSLCVAVDESGNLFASTNPTGGASAWEGITTNQTNFGFTSLSCASEALCVAVGPEGAVLTSTNPTGGVEAWQAADIDGTEVLTGVSCPSVELCVAVDQPGNVFVDAPTNEEPASKEETKSAGGNQNTTSPPPTVSPPSSVSPTSPPVLSGAQLAALLQPQLVPTGKAANVGALLKSGGLTLAVKAPEAGALVVKWYYLPKGAKLAKTIKAKPVLVASGKLTFSAAGTDNIKVRLTAAGKKLLKRDKRVKLTAQATFTPRSTASVKATRTFTLGRKP